MRDDDVDVPWLREMVQEDLSDLFSEDESLVRSAVVRVIAATQEDEELEDRLVELLETALELGNDDSDASMWTAVILGEIASRRAIGVLLRSLASESDEVLQDAAQVAILRIGPPALESLMDAIEEEEDTRLKAPGYHLLGNVGILQDEGLRKRVMDFLELRLEHERTASPGADLESLCRAMARIGDKRQIDPLKKILREDYEGRHGVLQDAIESLEENPGGEAIVQTMAPWEDRYGWLFEDQREAARVCRPPLPRTSAQEEEKTVAAGGEEGDGRQISFLYRGLNVSPPGDEPEEQDETAR